MNIEAKKQYMQTLRERYLNADKKGKTVILNEYCRNTGQDRKYSIKKFRYKIKLKNPEDRKKKTEIYDNSIKPTLVKLWEIFDYPCGQRLKTLIKDELEKLRNLNGRYPFFRHSVCSQNSEKLSFFEFFRFS